MNSYRYLLNIAIILLMTKVFGLFSKKMRMPSVVGALLAGIILGPAVLNFVQMDDLIKSLSEIGVIVLMFSAGLETSIADLKKAGPKAFVIALFGVLLPLVIGYWIGDIFKADFIESLFIGVIFTATSVGITVETLKEMGCMSTRSGNAILAAAVIDDVLGIVCLTLVSGLADSSVNIAFVLLKIVGFFIFSAIVSIIMRKFFRKWFDQADSGLQRYAIVSLAFALIMAYCSEVFFGVADITGSFVAGLIISGTSQCNYVTKRIGTLSYLLITPIFFASIGLELESVVFTGTLVLVIVILCIAAIVSKVVGCGLGALVCKYSPQQALRIGCGMVSRGEVALIVADKGMSLGILPEYFVTPILICVVFTTIITPILLKIVYKQKDNDPDFTVQDTILTVDSDPLLES